jgi:hypothetical protein
LGIGKAARAIADYINEVSRRSCGCLIVSTPLGVEKGLFKRGF